MKIILGVPVINQKELTDQLIQSLIETVEDPKKFELVIIDQGEKQIYASKEYGPKHPAPFKISVVWSKENRGYYYPLLQLKRMAKKGDAVGLIHNDVIIYEKGFDQRMRGEFGNDKKLSLIGLCGSNEVDFLGGRGQGTMCSFAGIKGQSQEAGKYIYGLYPAIVLDSLFMLFRYEVVDVLKIDKDIPLCHFMDRIWPLRLIENGLRVGVMGVKIDHIGGQTSVLETQYVEDARKWCLSQGIDTTNKDPGGLLYLEAERRYLTEYRDEKSMVPGMVDQNYKVTNSQGKVTQI